MVESVDIYVSIRSIGNNSLSIGIDINSSENRLPWGDEPSNGWRGQCLVDGTMFGGGDNVWWRGQGSWDIFYFLPP